MHETQSLEQFQANIGYTFSDPDLLRDAFTHRSYLNEHRNYSGPHNERLEFLGDAVLELIVSEFLYEKYPNHPEGDLTAFRAALVNTVSLAESAESLHYNDFLRLSKGESKDTGRARDQILANTFEAVLGAIYRDGGYQSANNFVAKVLFPKIDRIIAEKSYKDPKSLVQEEAQAHLSVTPRYELLETYGPDHDKTFTVGIYFGDQLVTKGQGKSKQDAQQMAAKMALKLKGWAGE